MTPVVTFLVATAVDKCTEKPLKAIEKPLKSRPAAFRLETDTAINFDLTLIHLNASIVYINRF